jgi:hypothetical protein
MLERRRKTLSGQNEMQVDIVLPASLVTRIQRLIQSGSQSRTVSEYVEKVVRASVVADESKVTEVYTEPEAETIRERLKDLGYL